MNHSVSAWLRVNLNFPFFQPLWFKAQLDTSPARPKALGFRQLSSAFEKDRPRHASWYILRPAAKTWRSRYQAEKEMSQQLSQKNQPEHLLWFAPRSKPASVFNCHNARMGYFVHLHNNTSKYCRQNSEAAQFWESSTSGIERTGTCSHTHT